MGLDLDLDVFLDSACFGVPVVFGTGEDAVTTNGIEDLADDVVLGDDGQAEVVGRVRTVLVKTSVVEAAGLAIGGTLTVNGTVRTARGIEAEPPDGALTRIALRG